MGKYDQYLIGLPESNSSPSGKYDQFTNDLPPAQADLGPMDKARLAFQMLGEASDRTPASFIKRHTFDPAGEKIAEVTGKSNNPLVRAAGVDLGVGVQMLPDTAGAMISSPEFDLSSNPIGNFIDRIKSIRNAPSALEDALGSAATKYGTLETPSMVGNTARTGLESEQSLNEALAKRLYGDVPKDIPVSTTKLANQYRGMSDELPPSIGNLVKKNIQLEPNPIRVNDIGTTNTKIYGQLMPDGTPVIPHAYSASPGVPSQLPPNNPSVGDLISLRSKLGAASRMGGIDGFNAGKLRAALDEDIANIGSGEGPLGKMMNEAVGQPLKTATNYYRELMQQQESPLYKKLATGKVEDIPDIIFKPGRTQDVLEARAALGEDGYQAAKKSFFNDLINSKDVGKAISKYTQSNSDFLNTAFNSSELNSLKTVADLQQKAVDAAKTVERARKLMTGAGAVAVGGGIAGKALQMAATPRTP